MGRGREVVMLLGSSSSYRGEHQYHAEKKQAVKKLTIPKDQKETAVVTRSSNSAVRSTTLLGLVLLVDGELNSGLPGEDDAVGSSSLLGLILLVGGDVDGCGRGDEEGREGVHCDRVTGHAGESGVDFRWTWE